MKTMILFISCLSIAGSLKASTDDNLKKVVAIQQAQIQELIIQNKRLQETVKVNSICSGKTDPKNTNWINYDPDNRPNIGTFTKIDFSHCNFKGTPNVVATLHGKSENWKVTYSIYNVSKTSFDVYITLPVLDNNGSHVNTNFSVYNSALKHDWSIHWIATE